MTNRPNPIYHTCLKWLCHAGWTPRCPLIYQCGSCVIHTSHMHSGLRFEWPLSPFTYQAVIKHLSISDQVLLSPWLALHRQIYINFPIGNSFLPFWQTSPNLRGDIKSYGKIAIFTRLKIGGGGVKTAKFGKIETKDRDYWSYWFQINLKRLKMSQTAYNNDFLLFSWEGGGGLKGLEGGEPSPANPDVGKIHILYHLQV